MAKAKKAISINGKLYKMPSWNFGDVRKLEACGFSIKELQNPEKNIFTAASAFVAVAANVSLEEADAIIEGHVTSGGDIKDMLNDFYTSLAESSFFGAWIKTLNKTQGKNQEQGEAAE